MAGGAGLAVIPLCSKPVGNQELDQDKVGNLQKPDQPKFVAPVSSAPVMAEAIRRPRGRPAGSKNKPKLPIIITRDSANTLRAHAMEVSSGCDVNESLTGYARKRQRGLCVLSGSGFVTNVTLKQPATTGSTVTLHGRFEILSMLGSILPPPAPPGITGLTIYIAGAQGQVIGGAVVGTLIASGPVVIMVASFTNATFDRLPLDEDDDASTIQSQQQYQNGRQQHQLDMADLYGMPQNTLTSGTLPRETYSWVPARTGLKN